uniref:RNase H type-1 domain-containing protein n=1 Tax=Cannabis sativa TaxID=3483 RepID=A0A803P423_CANSA
MDNQSIWGRIVQEKYLKHKHFMDIECLCGDSGLWKAIVKTRSLLSEGLCRKIGDGKRTSIWIDPWVPQLTKCPTPMLDATHGVPWVSQFIDENFRWKVDMVREWFDREDAKEILNIPLPHEDTQDGEWRLLSTYYGNALLLKPYGLTLGWELEWTELMLGNGNNERNGIVHGRDRSNVKELILNLNRRISEHRLVAIGDVVEVCVWTPSLVSWLCYNCDVAMSEDGSVIATLVRDENGSIFTGKAENKLVTDPKIAEAHAVCLAADLSVERKMGKVIFQSDNLRVVNAFSAEFEGAADFNLVNLRRRFLSICSALNEWKIVHVPRMGNFMAHNIAKWACTTGVVGNTHLASLDRNVLNDYVEWRKHAG